MPDSFWRISNLKNSVNIAFLLPRRKEAVCLLFEVINDERSIQIKSKNQRTITMDTGEPPAHKAHHSVN